MAKSKKRPGLWVRVHDRIWQDERVLALADGGERGVAAVAVFVMSVAWSHHDRRDGDLPRGILPLIHGKKHHADLLVKAGLWETTQSGWRIPRYAEWQDTREEIAANQEAKRKAGLTSSCVKNHVQPCTDSECPIGADNVINIERGGAANG